MNYKKIYGISQQSIQNKQPSTEEETFDDYEDLEYLGNRIFDFVIAE